MRPRKDPGYYEQFADGACLAHLVGKGGAVSVKTMSIKECRAQRLVPLKDFVRECELEQCFGEDDDD